MFSNFEFDGSIEKVKETSLFGFVQITGYFRGALFEVYIDRVTVQIKNISEKHTEENNETEESDMNEQINNEESADKSRDESHYEQADVDPLSLMKSTYPLIGQYWAIKFQIDKYFYRQGRKDGTDDGYKCKRYIEILKEIEAKLGSCDLTPYSNVAESCVDTIEW